MNKFTIKLVSCLIFISSSILTHCYSQSLESQQSVSNTYIIQFADASSQNKFNELKTSLFHSTIQKISLRNTLPITIIKAPGLDYATFTNLIANVPGVISVTQDALLETRVTPDDPMYGGQWDLNLIKANVLWDISTGGKTQNGHDIVLAILDDGFFITHEDLEGNLFTNPGEIPDNGIDDDHNGFIDDMHGVNILTGSATHEVRSHGTSVMSIMGAKGNNGKGMTGINWNIKLLPVSNSIHSVSSLIEAYDYVAGFRKKFNETQGQQGALVVAANLSGGKSNSFPNEFPAWCAIYDYLGSLGILSVGATVNANSNVEVDGDLPSLCTSQYLIMVTNTTKNDVLYSGAGYGSTSIDLGAPGEGCQGANSTGGYSPFGGTSCATPHVTGAIGLLYSIPGIQLQNLYLSDPSYAALTVKNAILNNVDLLPSLQNKTVTGGRLNLWKMLQNYSAIKDSAHDLTLVYPNPVSDILHFNIEIEHRSPDISVSIYSLDGQQIFQRVYTGSSDIQIDISTLPNGPYIYSIKSDSHINYGKFIKQ